MINECTIYNNYRILCELIMNSLKHSLKLIHRQIIAQFSITSDKKTKQMIWGFLGVVITSCWKFLCKQREGKKVSTNCMCSDSLAKSRKGLWLVLAGWGWADVSPAVILHETSVCQTDIKWLSWMLVSPIPSGFTCESTPCHYLPF